VVKLAVAIRDHISMIRPAPGSIPGRCILSVSHDQVFAYHERVAASLEGMLLTSYFRTGGRHNDDVADPRVHGYKSWKPSIVSHWPVGVALSI
jgi:hypothetical protein